MKKATTVVSLLIIGLLVLTGLTSQQRAGHVLVFSKTDGFRHDSIEPGIAAIEKLGVENGFTVEATEDAAVFTQQNLSKVHTVVFLNTTHDVLNEDQQNQFERYIQAGGGYVGIHAAADTEYDWAWYGKLAGGWFNGHPNNPNVRDATLHLVDGSHASSDMLPETWDRTDEWYDYKSLSDNITVLLTVDESTYREEPLTDNHPIAWYQEFDGGRSFYTGLGHTKESFTEELFLKHLLGGIQYTMGDRSGPDYSAATVRPEENRFTKQVFAENLFEPMELDLLPDGRILFVERRGDVHLYDPSTDELTTAAEIPVHHGEEDGLLGIAVDPNFAENNWLYMIYSPPGEDPKQHVSRFDFDGAKVDLDSEVKYLDIVTQRDECCHAGGSLEFDKHGNLFISVGDNTNPFASDGYAPIDGRLDRAPWDGRGGPANTQDLRGKILRITPRADGTYSIPDGNLFAKDGSEGRPEIYVMGNRNPFRISIDDRTGFLYWGEIGPDARVDSLGRGPKGHDEINQARSAGNFGWPLFVADNKPYHAYDFETKTSGPAFDPAAPVNDSPFNTGARILPPAQPAFIYYPYTESPEFPIVGTGGRNAMAGPVYYADDYADSDRKLPDYYDGKLFIYEWMRGWIMAVSMDENGDLELIEKFLPNMRFANPMDMLIGPDGAIYMLEYGTTWFAQDPEAKLTRIDFTKGNRNPVAQISSDVTLGAAPLTVNFDASESIDYDDDALTYEWSFGSDEISPTHTFTEPGIANVKLTVTDGEGNTSTRETTILVGNDRPEVAINIEGNQSFYWDDRDVVYSVDVTDTEDGSLSAGSIQSDQVKLTIDYLKEGEDLAEIAMGHQTSDEAIVEHPGLALIAGSDCLACHHAKSESIGPSYLAVADKYRDDENAVTTLSTRIVEGSSGIWGDRVMAAHPLITQAEASEMVRYILSLKEEASSSDSPSEALTGTFKTDQHSGTDGQYVLMASYTDAGAAEIGPLPAQSIVRLRGTTIKAATFDEAELASKFIIPDDAPMMAGQDIVMAPNNSMIAFNDVDLTDLSTLVFTVVAVPDYTRGGTVTVMAGSEPLGSCEAPVGAMPLPKACSFDISGVTGPSKLTMSFKTADGSDELALMALNLQFKP